MLQIYYLPGGRPVMENYYYASLLSTGKKLRETCHGELLLRFSFVRITTTGKKLSSLIALALNLDDHFFHNHTLFYDFCTIYVH
ncbi:hypothetical protein Tco_0126372 [Tanacetum coccineum]